MSGDWGIPEVQAEFINFPPGRAYRLTYPASHVNESSKTVDGGRRSRVPPLGGAIVKLRRLMPFAGPAGFTHAFFWSAATGQF